MYYEARAMLYITTDLFSDLGVFIVIHEDNMVELL